MIGLGIDGLPFIPRAKDASTKLNLEFDEPGYVNMLATLIGERLIRDRIRNLFIY
jgi:hypothetical protein